MSVAPDREEASVRDESMVDVLARAYHLLAESFHEQVRWHGLAVTEWRVLAVLADQDGIAMTELAELVLFKQPTLTKAVDRMERAQLVQRRTPTEDRRRTHVYLTERGRRAAMPLVQRARQHDNLITHALGEATSSSLKSSLFQLIEQIRLLPREQRPRRAVRPSSTAQGD